MIPLNRYTPLLIVVCLLMRLSTGIFNLVYGPVQGANFAIVMDAFQWLTVIVILLLNKENLSLFKIDQLYLLIILVFGGVFRPAMQGEPIILYWATSLLLVFIPAYFLLFQKTFKRPSLGWSAVGFGVGLLGGLIRSILGGSSGGNYLLNESMFLPFLSAWYLHVSRITALEEIIFRGVLWGYLERQNLSPQRILLLQTALFWVVHVDQISRPGSFFIILPVASILFGMLVWKSGTLTPSVLAHTTYNTFISLLKL